MANKIFKVREHSAPGADGVRDGDDESDQIEVGDWVVAEDVQDGNWLGVVVSDEYLKEDEPMVDLLHFEQQVSPYTVLF